MILIPTFTNWLNKQNKLVFNLYAILAAFLTYSCMYAFRKPFSVATFDNMIFFGVHYKIWLITAQVLGYTISKFLGIKVISEMKARYRALAIIAIILVAHLALLGFACTPAPYNIVFLFINGLPLGLVWGLVLSYLEGRSTTEILSAGLSVSFIFASGFIKSVGKFLILNFNISEFWMPFYTGLIFMIPLILAVFFLNQIPEPTLEDKKQRTERKPMTTKDRKNFIREYAFIITGFIMTYVALTILRDIRDNYAAELWIELGLGNTPELFTLTEIPVGVGVLLIMGLCALIKDNIKALHTSILLILVGFAIVLAGTFSLQHNIISGTAWMILVGFGLYLGYIAYHTMVFERLIATFKIAGNIGFIFYLADSFGYLGSIGSFLMKNFLSPDLSWLNFYKQLSYTISITGIFCVLIAYYFSHNKYQKKYNQKAEKSENPELELITHI
ncbi:hypothetical protein EYV94_26975 [Puteibacter caeruleilacunae]|nr:hypothetical protein EYV94_26975 [Puteibacter caeruleilacunae]